LGTQLDHLPVPCLDQGQLHVNVVNYNYMLM